MTTFLDSTPEVRCARYRREFQLPASVDPGSGRILLHIGIDYGAVSMPAELGEQVLRRLGQDGIAGPVVDHPRARRWTFLTGPGQPGGLSTAVSAELFRLYATVAGAGSQVVLPSPDDERTGYRIWIRPPETAAHRPPPEAVIAALRAVAARKIRAR
ncbi:hypothetical protein IU459_07285 [Nocardia amamiensis]|uniref:DNA-directed RNA polymerase subunit beta n=1 Tax=Nocardia amamiensis TaxID=404578 RepID=A0ABS0CNF6_9NOCA|nr:hypothetical protein [Nocardia amamiensis]MBF6297347.1 hypothetical protein [Nocardia amamiensis]